MVDIEPVGLDILQKSKDGKMMIVENDVGNVATDIQAISDDLRLSYNERGDYFVVYQVIELPNGYVKEHLVTTSKTCDPRLVQRVREITSDAYNFAEEMEKQDAKADKEHDARMREKVGEKGERLSHALRKDLGVEKDSARSRKNWGKQ